MSAPKSNAHTGLALAALAAAALEPTLSCEVPACQAMNLSVGWQGGRILCHFSGTRKRLFSRAGNMTPF